MQEKEKDALEEGTRIEVMYCRKDGIDPPISIFEGTLKQFLKQSEIEPYGKKLTYSGDNHEVIVAVQRRDNGRTVELVAKEIQRARD